MLRSSAYIVRLLRFHTPAQYIHPPPLVPLVTTTTSRQRRRPLHMLFYFSSLRSLSLSLSAYHLHMPTIFYVNCELCMLSVCTSDILYLSNEKFTFSLFVVLIRLSISTETVKRVRNRQNWNKTRTHYYKLLALNQYEVRKLRAQFI